MFSSSVHFHIFLNFPRGKFSKVWKWRENRNKAGESPAAFRVPRVKKIFLGKTARIETKSGRHWRKRFRIDGTKVKYLKFPMQFEMDSSGTSASPEMFFLRRAASCSRSTHVGHLGSYTFQILSKRSAKEFNFFNTWTLVNKLKSPS